MPGDPVWWAHFDSSVPRLGDVAAIPRRDSIAQQSLSTVYHVRRDALQLGAVASASGSGDPVATGPRADDPLAPAGFTWVAAVAEGDAAAVKIIELPQGAGGEEDTERKKQLGAAACAVTEARVLRLLSAYEPLATRAPRLLGVGESASCVAVAMSFVRACPLHRLFIDAAGPSHGLAQPFVAAVVAQVVWLLRALHRGPRVVHRDVKLPNVLVGNTGKVFLIDYGCAAPVGAATVDTMGTLHTQAPEVRTEGSRAAASLDVFSVGVLLYELSFGQPPFGFGPVPDDADARLASCPVSRAVVPKGCPAPGVAALTSLVRGLMAHRVEDRLGCASGGGGGEVDWDAVMAHPYFAYLPAAWRGEDAAGLDAIDAVAFDASAPYADEVDMQLLGF